MSEEESKVPIARILFVAAAILLVAGLGLKVYSWNKGKKDQARRQDAAKNLKEIGEALLQDSEREKEQARRQHAARNLKKIGEALLQDSDSMHVFPKKVYGLPQSPEVKEKGADKEKVYVYGLPQSLEMKEKEANNKDGSADR